MEQFKISALHDLKVYNSSDYIEKNKEVNDSFLSIIASHENTNAGYDVNKAREYIEDLNYKMFLDDLDTRIYILHSDGHPVSFALYNRIEKTNDWIMELIYTHSEYTTLGLATALLRLSAKDLSQRFDAENIHTTVSKKNYASMYLHDSFSKVEGVKVSTDNVDSRIKFRFNIKELKNTENKSKETELLF